MNQELKNRFDALSSSSENEKLTWSEMAPSIQEALQKPAKKRRVFFWWWGGATSVLLFSAALMYFFIYQSPQTFIAANSAKSQGHTAFAKTLHEQAVSGAPEVAEAAVKAGASTQSGSLLGARVELLPSVDELDERGSFSGLVSSDEPVRHKKAAAEYGYTSSIQAREKHSSSNVNTALIEQSSLQSKTASLLKASRDLQGKRRELVGASVAAALRSGRSPREGFEAESSPFERLEYSKLKAFATNENVIDTLPQLYSENVIVMQRSSIFSTSILRITASGGGSFGNAAQAYNQAEDFLGWTAGVGLEYEMSHGWFGGLGFKADRISFSARTTLIDTVREFRPGQVGRVYTFSNNQTVVEFSDSVSVQITRNVLHHNVQTDYSMPVHLGYRWKRGKWGLSVRAGANLLIRQQLEGRLLTGANEIQDVDQRSAKVSIMPQIGGDLSYQLHDRWEASVMATGYRSVGVSTIAIDQPSQFWIGQVQCGLKYRIN
ncbi:MAG: hypothetical protein AB8F78_01775 [Saprospiraceae bacterium]